MPSATAKPGISVRKASLKDVPLIAALGAHTFTETFGFSVPAEDLAAFLEDSYSISAITNDLHNPDKDMIVAVNTPSEEPSHNAHQDAILGFSYLTRNSTEPCVEEFPSTVELQRIYVHPDAHGRGVGRALSEKIDEMAREQGFKNIWLGVWEEHHKAHQFYGKMGYRNVGKHDFVTGKEVQTDNVMLKAL